MLRKLTFDKGLRLFNRALALNGTRLGVTCAEVDLSAGCQSPVTVEYVGRRERFLFKYHVVQPLWNDPLTWESVSVIIQCKCRQCEACLRKRRIHWYHRAKFEISVAPRTWFGTLTYSPDELFKRRILAERRARAQGSDYGSLSEDERFKALLRECGTDVTLALKRLRKAASGPIRYLLVSERHKSGMPHWHILIHERAVNAVTHRVLKRCWSAGFSDFKLADPKAAGYVAKYISKEAGARVRASSAYGEQSAFSVSLALPPAAEGEDAERGRGK